MKHRVKQSVQRFFNEQRAKLHQREQAREVTRVMSGLPRMEFIKGPEGRAFLPSLDCLGLPL